MVGNACLAQAYAELQKYKLWRHQRFFVALGLVKKTGASFAILAVVAVAHLAVMFALPEPLQDRQFLMAKVTEPCEALEASPGLNHSTS